jgi:hypothetical protein
MTDDTERLIRLIMSLLPHDQAIMRDLMIGLAQREQTGETAALDRAIEAFAARVHEKQRIARN